MNSRSESLNRVFPPSDPLGGIYPKEIEKIKERIHVGDYIRVKSTKGYVNLAPDSDNTKSGTASRRGTVIAKHRHLVVLEYPGGLTESFRWSEMAAM